MESQSFAVACLRNSSENIETAGICTQCNERILSYRAGKGMTSHLQPESVYCDVDQEIAINKYQSMQYAALIIFILTYTGIIFTRLPKMNIDRPSAAFFGAVSMVLFGVLSFDEAIRAIDFNTIAAAGNDDHYFNPGTGWFLFTYCIFHPFLFKHTFSGF